MQIEENTCFVKYHPYTKMESVGLRHYKEVWHNGYTVDDYSIYLDDIYYENAAHNGINPAKIDAGTYIMRKQFFRWIKQIQQAKETAIRMLQKNATPINRNLEVGDFILYTWVDYEEDEEYRLDNAYYGMRIVDIKDDSIIAQNLYIDENYFQSNDKLNSFEEINDILINSSFITAETFMVTHDYMRSFCRDLFDEIKSHIRTKEKI